MPSRAGGDGQVFDIGSVPAEPRVLVLSSGGESARAIAAQLREQGFAVTVEHPISDDVNGSDVILIDQFSTREPWRLDAATMVQPVLVIGADNSADICEAFSRGAVDYIVPPPRIRELASRIRAALRRRAYEQPPARANNGGEIDPALRERMLGTVKAALSLSAQEERLLSVLAANPGHIVTRSELARRIWGVEVDPRVIADHMRRLRAKLARIDDFPIEITLVRGVGYRVSQP